MKQSNLEFNLISVLSVSSNNITPSYLNLCEKFVWKNRKKYKLLNWNIKPK